MYGLTINNFIDSTNVSEYDMYCRKTSTMDINNMFKRTINFPPFVDEAMPNSKIDDT